MQVGTASAGVVNFYFDPASNNGFIVLQTWFARSAPREPFPAHSLFMLRSMCDSFSTIP